jgi:hypothetical protein
VVPMRIKSTRPILIFFVLMFIIIIAVAIWRQNIRGARNRILILSFPSDQTIIVGYFLSKLCDYGPIKQRMHVLPVYMICFLKLLPQITPDYLLTLIKWKLLGNSFRIFKYIGFCN